MSSCHKKNIGSLYLLGWFTGDGPPKLGEGPAAARFGDALGGSFAGDQGSLIPFPAAEVGAAEATPPQGSSWGCLAAASCCWTGIPQGSIEEEAAVLVGGGGCAIGFPKSKSKRSFLLLLDFEEVVEIRTPLFPSVSEL